MLTGFLVEGIRLAATLPAWSVYSPIGHLVAKMLLACGLSEAELRLLHTWIWTIHGISSLAFIAAVPLTYYAHVYRTPAGLFTREEKPAGLLRNVRRLQLQSVHDPRANGLRRLHGMRPLHGRLSCGPRRNAA